MAGRQMTPGGVRLLCLAFLILSNTFAASGDPSTDVEKLLTQFATLTGPATDILVKYGLISSGVGGFVTLMAPVGANLATWIDMGLAPESAELKAITLLSKLTEKKFEALEALNRELFGNLSMDITWMEYKKNVVVPLALIEPLFARVMNATAQPSATLRENFIRQCTGETTGPRAVLKWMVANSQRLSIPTNDTTRVICECNSVFREIEQRFALTLVDKYSAEFMEYSGLKNALVRELSHMDYDLAHFSIDKFRNESLFTNNRATPKANAQLIKREFGFINLNGGLLEDVRNTNKWLRDPLLRVGEMLANHALKVAFIGGMCNVEVNRLDPYEIAAGFTEIRTDVEEIIRRMAQFVNATLRVQERTWPNMVREYAIAALGPKDIVDYQQYGFAAAEVADAVNARGPKNPDGRGPKFIAQVIVSENWDGLSWYHWHCNNVSEVGYDPCLVIKNQRGVNVFIARFPVESFARSELAHKWFTNNERQIRQVIIENYKTDDLSAVLKEIDRHVPGLLSPNLYRSRLFLHNSKLKASSCVINVGWERGIATLFDLPNSEMVEYFYDPTVPVRDAERFKLFMLD